MDPNRKSLEALPSFSRFKSRIAAAIQQHPESEWHLRGSERRVYETIRKMMPHLRPGNVLVDIGCLPPNIPVGLHVLGLLGEVEYHGTCVDQEDALTFSLAESLGVGLQRVNLDPKFDLFPAFKSYPWQTSFADSSVDIVVMTEVLEHMVWPHSVISESARILKPGGVLIGSTPNSTNAGALLKCILGQTPFEWYEDTHLTSDKYMKHVRFYSFRDLQKLFEEHGLGIVTRKYISFENIYAGQKGLITALKKVFRRILHIMPWWRESLLFVAKKSERNARG